MVQGEYIFKTIRKHHTCIDDHRIKVNEKTRTMAALLNHEGNNSNKGDNEGPGMAVAYPMELCTLACVVVVSGWDLGGGKRSTHIHDW
jgi:hypothetical protein